MTVAQRGSSPAGLPSLVGSPYRLSVEQYHRMIAGGVLTERDPVELLEGVLVEKMAHNPPHDVAIGLLQEALGPLLPPGWILRIQSAITTKESEPEPDVVLVPGPARRYLQGHPGPLDVALVIEVADSTLEQDREDKKRIYARARLGVYWIVNIPEACVEVYTQPRAGKNPTYREQHNYAGDDLVPVLINGRRLGQVRARDLLP